MTCAFLHITERTARSCAKLHTSTDSGRDLRFFSAQFSSNVEEEREFDFCKTDEVMVCESKPELLNDWFQTANVELDSD